MHYCVLACDYDGTLARDGAVSGPTVAALEAVRASGRSLVLVTGRELDELAGVFARLDLFRLVVAENGAVLHRPHTAEEVLLAEPPPAAFVAALRARGVARVSAGRVIVATWEPYEAAVHEAIDELGLALQVVLNKGAVMVLPEGVDKASGLTAALDELGSPPGRVVGIGDAENDSAFLELCGVSVAVANALPALQARCDLVTRASHGEGVAELAELLLCDDLASVELRRVRPGPAG